MFRNSQIRHWALVSAVLCAIPAPSVLAQVVEAASGSTAKLDYDARYTHSFWHLSGGSGLPQTATLSAEVFYQNGSERLPLRLEYSGGETWGLNGYNYGSGLFQHIDVSQGIVSRKARLTFSDDLQLSPFAPASGLSGQPGIGGLLGIPGSTTVTVLQNSRTIINSVNVDYQRMVTGDDSLDGQFDQSIVRFPDGNGLDLDLNSIGFDGGYTRRLDGRTNLGARYDWRTFTYPKATVNFHMNTQEIQATFDRKWTRRWNTSAGGGPIWVTSNDSSIVRNNVGIAASVKVGYDMKSAQLGLSYNRQVIGGSGVTTQIGVHTDQLQAQVTHQFNRDITLEGEVAYLRSSLLTPSTDVTTTAIQTVVGTVQVIDQFGRNWDGFASYSLMSQPNGVAGTFAGTNQIFSIGIGYHPREIRIVRR